MSGQSTGLIETVGLAVAVEAADAAMKSANVGLTGYELTKGGGLVTVKLTGEVGAINAAVAAGVAAASRIGTVSAWKVLARTAAGIDSLINATDMPRPEVTVSAAPDVTTPAHPEAQNAEPQHAESQNAALPAIAVVNIDSGESLTGCSMLTEPGALSPASQPGAEKAAPEEVKAAADNKSRTGSRPKRPRK